MWNFFYLMFRTLSWKTPNGVLILNWNNSLHILQIKKCNRTEEYLNSESLFGNSTYHNNTSEINVTSSSSFSSVKFIEMPEQNTVNISSTNDDGIESEEEISNKLDTAVCFMDDSALQSGSDVSAVQDSNMYNESNMFESSFEITKPKVGPSINKSCKKRILSPQIKKCMNEKIRKKAIAEEENLNISNDFDNSENYCNGILRNKILENCQGKNIFNT